MILFELLIKNYKKCLYLLLDNIKEIKFNYNFNMKNINLTYLIINILIFFYNKYLYINYYFMSNINCIEINNSFKLIIYKSKINMTRDYLFVNCIESLTNFIKLAFIQLHSKLLYIKLPTINYALNPIIYSNNFNRYLKYLIHFKKFDDMNNKLIPTSTLETNLVISLAIVETNIYTFHIFNLTIAHNLDVYINNELGDEDMIESSVDDIGD